MAKAKTDALASTAIFDLDAVAYADTFDYRVKHPKTGDETTWTVTLAGPGHPQTIDALERQFREDQDEEEERQQEAIDAVKAGKPAPKNRRTIAELRARNAARLAARIVSSTPARINGETVELGPDNAAGILASPAYEWLFNQLFGAVNDKASFMQGSAPTS